MPHVAMKISGTCFSNSCMVSRGSGMANSKPDIEDCANMKTKKPFLYTYVTDELCAPRYVQPAIHNTDIEV